MKIHALNTATIHVKSRYVDAGDANRLTRLSRVLFDRTWRDIPVYMWVIEHPEGLIVIDVGESARVNELGYFPLLQMPYWRSQYRFHVTPERESGAQMRARGLSPDDVRWVILTHTHFDHTDALYHFPKAEVLLTRREHDDLFTFRSAHFAFPNKFPNNVRFRLIDFQPIPLGAFPQSYPLTQAGDVHLLPTPGHTPGHQSIALQQDGVIYFFGGDAAFDQPSLLADTIDAPAFNRHQVIATRDLIRQTAAQTPLIFLATHDPSTAQRLEQRIALNGERIPV